MKEAYEIEENLNMEVEITYEQHVQQNNERLLSIKEVLCFDAIIELLEIT